MNPAAPLPRHWLVKQEPAAYPFAQLARDGRTAWTGVRNYQARNFLRAMQVGDPVLYYHSVSEKRVVGVAVVVRAAYPDPTAPAGEDWSSVDLGAERLLPHPVPLARLKADPTLAGLALWRQSRLSVMPLSAAEFARVVELGENRRPDHGDLGA